MSAFLGDLFGRIFGDNIVLATILIATIPIIELRGAIPFATNTKIWGELAITNWEAFPLGFIGSSVIVFGIALLYIPLIKWLKKTKLFGKLACYIENRVRSKTEGIKGADEKSKRFSKAYWIKVLATFIFVAIPLPLTGAWTGTCVAVFIGLDYWTSCFTVIAGNFVAGLLITLILQVCPWLNNYLLYIFLVLILIFIGYEVIKHLIKKNKQKKENQKGLENEKSNDENKTK